MGTEFETDKYKAFDPSADNIQLLIDSPCVYAICAKDITALPECMCSLQYKQIHGYRVIYVGQSVRGVRARDYRNHFCGSARNSTLRKSIGVLWGLQRHYYNNGKYRFMSEDETWLTNWMHNNLVLFYCAADDLDHKEQLLIDAYNPPLNIKNNRNTVNLTFRDHLKTLRCQRFDR